MNIKDPPKLNAIIEKRKITFYYEEIYEWEIPINQSLIEYYNDLPPMSINPIPKNYGLSNDAGKLFIELKKIVKTKSNIEALNILLAFCQFGITYAKDVELFGREVTLFPESTVLLGSGDCEDKSLLFANIVSTILKYKTVIFVYTDHADVGVEFKNGEGHYKLFQNRNYLICEPSFEGFVVGKTNVMDEPIIVVE